MGFKFRSYPNKTTILTNLLNTSFFEFFKKAQERKKCQRILTIYFKNNFIPPDLLNSYLKSTTYYSMFHKTEHFVLKKTVYNELKSILNLASSVKFRELFFDLNFLATYPEKQSKNFFSKFYDFKYFLDKTIANFIYPSILISKFVENLFKFVPIFSNLAVFCYSLFHFKDFFESIYSLAYLNFPLTPIYYSIYIKNKILDYLSLQLNLGVKRVCANLFSYSINYNQYFANYIYLN